jgi:hypothetical protein
MRSSLSGAVDHSVMHHDCSTTLTLFGGRGIDLSLWEGPLFPALAEVGCDSGLGILRPSHRAILSLPKYGAGRWTD